MIIDDALLAQVQADIAKSTDPKNPGVVYANVSPYLPGDDERKVRQMVIDCFRASDVIMRKPMREFNDLSVIERMVVDQMSFNTYQPNNGDTMDADEFNSWKSKAIRPIVRNKCISIAAHATARLIFPKFFAVNKQSERQKDAATVMRDLFEWACEQNDYARYSMYSVMSALVNPAAIQYIGFEKAYRTVKTERGADGKWKTKKVLDKEFSGFRNESVPCDELFIGNIRIHDIQKQPWLIWRRVQDYGNLANKYSSLPNFKHVKPGVQVIYNDANTQFYEVYDNTLRQNLCEEVIFWSRNLDLMIVMVNGVMLTEPDNPNPRLDKAYPFVKFGYELVDEGKFFYYKSLAFKMQSDAEIINTLYPMIIDGTYLSMMPPMVATGGEIIGSDVVVPGMTTTLADKDSTLAPMEISKNMQAGMNTLFKIEESINESSQEPIMQGQSSPGSQTAYEISKIEGNAQTVLGMFVKMISYYVKQYGELLKSDIIQNITIGELSDITDNPELVYKTIYLPDKNSGGRKKTKKIKFDISLPEKESEEKELERSYNILEQEGGTDGDQEIYMVNPKFFRELDFQVIISPDVLNPLSEELERAFGLELYDRAIANPNTNLEEVTRDFLFGLYPKAKDNVDKYIKKAEPVMPNMGQAPLNANPLASLQPQPMPMAQQNAI